MPAIRSVQAPPWPAGGVEEAFPATPHAAGQARRLVRRTTEAWRLPSSVIDDAELVVSEAVANASCHAGTPLVVGIVLDDLSLLVRVADGDVSRELTQAEPDRGAEHGRGVMLIAALSSEWGVEQTAIGKRVWARIRIPTS